MPGAAGDSRAEFVGTLGPGPLDMKTGGPLLSGGQRLPPTSSPL